MFSIKKKTLSTITSSFSKIKEELEEFISEQVLEKQDTDNFIDSLENKRKDINDNILKANKIAANLNKLLGE